MTDTPSPPRTTERAQGDLSDHTGSPGHHEQHSQGLPQYRSQGSLFDDTEEEAAILRATVHRQLAHTVTKESLLAYVDEERFRTVACLHFPMMTLYFVVFVCVVLAHEDMQNVAQAERELRAAITGSGYAGLPDGSLPHKDIEDVDSIGDLYEYLDTALLPRFLLPRETRDLGRGEEQRVERYSRLLGGVQLQQRRRRELECTEAYPNLGPLAKGSNTNPLLEGVQCYPWNDYSSECIDRGVGLEGFCPDAPNSSQPLNRLLSPMRRLFSESHAQKVRGGSSEDSLYSVVFHSHEGIEEALDRLVRLQDLEWLDTATSWVGIKAFVLNPDLAIYSHVLVNVWFPPNGQVIPHLRISSYLAAPYRDSSILQLDILFMVLWMHSLLRCGGSLLYAIFFQKLRKYVLDIWMWVEWLGMLGGIAVMCGWYVFIGMLGKVQNLAMDMSMTQPRQEDGWQFTSEGQQAAYSTSVTALHTEVDALASFLQSYRIFICWYTLLIACRFFEVFMAQPRLATVTNTFMLAFVDIGHFLVVLCSSFITFALAGMLLFGHRLLEFSEFHIATHSCFLIMLGDFDYETLSSEHPVTAALWFVLFAVVVAIILLNMALAIIMDVYMEVCADSAQSDTIWAQASGLVSSFWHRSEWCSLRKVVEAEERLPDEGITAEILTEHIPEMPVAQAMDVMDKVEEREVREESKGMSLSEATRFVYLVQQKVEAIGRTVDVLVNGELANKKELEEILEAYPLDPASGEFRPVHYIGFDEDSDHRLHVVEKRLLAMEEQLQETMKGTVAGAKEMRHTLTLIEDMMRIQADASEASLNGPMPRLR